MITRAIKWVKSLEMPLEWFNFPRLNFSEIIYQLFWYLIGCLIIFLLIFLKTHSVEYFLYSPIIFIYTMFVTIFRISRVWAATFYRFVDNNIKTVGVINNYTPPRYVCCSM